MKKRGWIVLFLAFPLWMQGQSAREEIGKNPALAAGNIMLIRLRRRS